MSVCVCACVRVCANTLSVHVCINSNYNDASTALNITFGASLCVGVHWRLC